MCINRGILVQLVFESGVLTRSIQTLVLTFQGLALNERSPAATTSCDVVASGSHT